MHGSRAIYSKLAAGTQVRFIGPDPIVIRRGPDGEVKAQWDTRETPLATVNGVRRSPSKRLIVTVKPEGTELFFEVLAGEIELAKKRGKKQ